ncbi:MAG TPA: FxsA family protein [Actinomycetes bacterium]|nr:FxsA family protein [Actinomycetes bacterium]
MIAALLLAFLIVPIVEIAVIIEVGSWIGVVPTVVLLLVESLLGAWIVKHEGLRTWRALRAAVTEGRLPDRELADGALVLVGGALLLAPGFVTDLAGFFLVLPLTRPLARAGLLWLAVRRAPVVRVVTRR